ncbi:hypothetical protein CASFOL_017332 [Castilleja foliolosa]|uniref:Cytochrome P450 n=1 Tax=Castilleja foliolosa TaxID=1961234 RepID=A0ABD3DAU0_9LAMI
MLVVHQDWQARAREEVFQVLGDKSKIDADDVGQLKILNMIVHEVLRLYPPSVEVTRVVEEETGLGDLRLPKGAMVMLPVILLHQNPRIWGDDALEFKPERFAKEWLKQSMGKRRSYPSAGAFVTALGRTWPCGKPKCLSRCC